MSRLTNLKPRLAVVAQSRFAGASIDSTSWRSGKTTADRGYGAKWRRARVSFLSANPLCCYCGREGRVTAATVVDHVTPHEGDYVKFWDEANWQPLCASHHSGAKAKEEGRGQK